MKKVFNTIQSCDKYIIVIKWAKFEYCPDKAHMKIAWCNLYPTAKRGNIGTSNIPSICGSVNVLRL